MPLLCLSLTLWFLLPGGEKAVQCLSLGPIERPNNGLGQLPITVSRAGPDSER